MEEIVGLGNASHVWRGWIGYGNLHLSLSGRAGRPRPRRQHHYVSAGRRREGDKGVWMSVWVDDVDEMHKHCVDAGLEITFPPTDMPWNVREMHLRHPDGHVFRVGRGFEPKK